MNVNQPSVDQAPVHSLSAALTKNQEAKEAVQDVADELGVVHAVLIQEVAKIADDEDASTAVQRTAALEKKLTETARKMDEVNQAIAEQHASLEHLKKAK